VRRSVAAPAWVCYGVLGCLSALLFVTSDGRPWVQVGAQILIYTTSGCLLAWRWKRTRADHPDPLLTLAVVAFGLYFVASVVGSLVPQLSAPGDTSPVPSAGDGLFLLSYALLGLFLWRLGSRSGGAGRRDLLDTLIVVGSVAPLFWLYLMAPLLATGAPPAALTTYLAYPVSVFALVCLTARLAFVARRRSVLHLLLAGWIVGELSADIVFLDVSVNGLYVYGQAWQALWILSATCIGSAALHPQLRVLLERHTLSQVNGPRRLWLLSGFLATPMVTIFYEEFTDDADVGVLVAAASAFFLVFLRCLRLSGLMVDNAARRRAQARLRELSDHLAFQTMHDPLTGLGNRLLFADHADRALAEAGTSAERATAVLLLDLDDFKIVNDSFGHEAGDRVLVEVARRLRRVTTRGESVFRLGGDEFAFVLPHARLEDALRLADRIFAALAEPFYLGPRPIRPLASIGVSIALDGQSRSTLLAEADLAMYAGKARGTGQASVFDPTLHREHLDRHQLERDLGEAVGRDEISVLYQPLVGLANREVIGVEALLRWQHPTRGAISPVQFIPLAEKTGAILDLGDWVLEQSLRQLRAWDESCPGRRLRALSVNVSPRQLADPEFVDRAAGLLARSGIDPRRLTLEITEAAFGADAEAMVGRLHELKLLGLNLAIDDFGTEYSSLSKLRQIPVDVLKIDKSFIDGIAIDPSERALAGAIVSLGSSLGKLTVAEGIETEEQLAELISLDVEYGQGYLFSRPVPADEITTMLRLAPGTRVPDRT
jgi:diguanylate cyclase (GGDEF)-like protein